MTRDEEPFSSWREAIDAAAAGDVMPLALMLSAPEIAGALPRELGPEVFVLIQAAPWRVMKTDPRKKLDFNIARAARLHYAELARAHVRGAKTNGKVLDAAAARELIAANLRISAESLRAFLGDTWRRAQRDERRRLGGEDLP